MALLFQGFKDQKNVSVLKAEISDALTFSPSPFFFFLTAAAASALACTIAFVLLSKAQYSFVPAFEQWGQSLGSAVGLSNI